MREDKYKQNAEWIVKAQKGDEKAMEALIVNNAGLVNSIAAKFLGRGTDYEDLVQIGNIGLLKAIRSFDLGRECAFSTYAVPLIFGEIRRFLRDDGAVKVGRSMREKGQMLWSVRERLRQQLGRDPRLSEVAQESGLSVEEIASIDLANASPESLQQETAEGLTLESTLGTTGPEECLVEKIALREAIDTLPERERMTILLRFFKGFTQQQTARVLQVSQVQVSRLERRGLCHLRELLQDS